MQTPKADDVPPRRRVEEDVQRLDSLRLFLRRNAQTLDAVESVVQVRRHLSAPACSPHAPCGFCRGWL